MIDEGSTADTAYTYHTDETASTAYSHARKLLMVRALWSHGNMALWGDWMEWSRV